MQISVYIFMAECTLRQTENNFLRWSRVYGTFSIQDMQAAGGIPEGCNPADLAPPTNLVATSGLSQVTLTWEDNTGNETGYQIYRSTVMGFTPSAANLLTTVGQVETYADTTATVGTVYYYVVRAFNNEGFSAFSNEASGQIFNAFQITVKTDNSGTSNNDQFKMPLVALGTYDFDVYLNGAIIKTVTDYTDDTITFADGAGTYEIALVPRTSSDLKGWQFNNSGDRLKLTNISRWGEFKLTNTGGYFYGCSNLTITASDSLDLTGITLFANAFRSCSSLTSISGIDLWDTGAITSFNRCFQGCTNMDANVGGWDVSNCTDFFAMFLSCSSFNQDLSSWSFTASPFTLESIFQSCTVFNNGGSSDINNWSMGSCTSIAAVFALCPAFNQPVGNWTLTNNTSLISTFNGATIFNQDISSWDTSNVTTARFTFNSASAFNQDISGWNMAAITDFTNFLSGATSFNQDLSNWDNDLATGRAGGTPTMANCFNNCGINTTNYDSMLVSWAAVDLVNSVTIGVNGLQYTAAAAGGTARTDIMTNDLWSFVGDSGV